MRTRHSIRFGSKILEERNRIFIFFFCFFCLTVIIISNTQCSTSVYNFIRADLSGQYQVDDFEKIQLESFRKKTISRLFISRPGKKNS
jgi:hypothetical protein